MKRQIKRHFWRVWYKIWVFILDWNGTRRVRSGSGWTRPRWGNTSHGKMDNRPRGRIPPVLHWPRQRNGWPPTAGTGTTTPVRIPSVVVTITVHKGYELSKRQHSIKLEFLRLLLSVRRSRRWGGTKREKRTGYSVSSLQLKLLKNDQLLHLVKGILVTTGWPAQGGTSPSPPIKAPEEFAPLWLSPPDNKSADRGQLIFTGRLYELATKRWH